ncbi:MAG: SpoIID/LytB domain-containing protein [Planctomycetota bacterium]
MTSKASKSRSTRVTPISHGAALVRAVTRACVRTPVSTLAALSLAGVLLMLTGLVACDLQRRTLTPTSAEFGVEPLVRIRVERNEPSAVLSSDGPVRAWPASMPQPDERAALFTAPVRVAADAGGVRVTGAAGGSARFAQGTIVRLGATSHTLAVNDVPVGPTALAMPRSDDTPDRLDVIAELPMESYIAGVAAAELVPGWAPEAYRAQAVAARSYAVHQRARARGMKRSYDLDSTVRDQAFKGLTEDRRVIDATNDTRGIILASGGRPLRAYYSSTCGGRAASAADVWTVGRGLEFNRPAPLQARVRDCPCQASPLYRWERTRPLSGVAARIAEWGKDRGHAVRALRGIRRIDVNKRNVADRPSSYRVVDTRGKSFVLSAEELRVATNTSVRTRPGITRETRIPAGDFEVTIRGNEATFTGRGFGHGVGMCQFGAQGLAMRGQTWIEILGRYYPGARVERQW